MKYWPPKYWPLLFLVLGGPMLSGAAMAADTTATATANVAADLAGARVITGTAARVLDGATLILSGGERVRLFGIMPPNATQKCEQENRCVPCGEEARRMLERLAVGPLRCEVAGKTLGRTLARCYIRGGHDLGLTMLRYGQAVTFARHLRRNQTLPYEYLDGAAMAQSQGLGLWAGAFADPWHWRHAAARVPCEYGRVDVRVSGADG